MLSRRKSQILKQYILCNLILFVLPVMIFTIMYYLNIQEQLINNIVSNQQHALEQAVNDIENHLDEFHIISTRLSYDEHVTPYQISRGGLSKMEAVRRIRSYQSLNNFFELLFIFYSDQELILSNTGESILDVFIGYEYTLNGPWDIDDFKEFLATPEKNQFSAQNCTLVNNVSHMHYVAVANPMPIYSSNPYASTVVLIQQGYFANLLSDAVGDIVGSSCVLDSDGQVLFYANNNMALNYEDLPFSIEQISQGEKKIKIDGKTYTVTSLHHDTTGWTFLTLFPNYQFPSRFLTERWPVLLIIVLVMLLGIALGIYIAVRNYKPIYKLKNALNGSILQMKGIGEMSSIQQAVQNISERNQELAKQLKQNRPLIASNLINYIVSGTKGINSPEFADKLDALGISLAGPYYAMAAMRIPRPISSSEAESLISAIYAQSKGRAYGFSMAFNKTIAILINLTDESSLEDYIQALSATVEQTLNCYPIIGVGSLCSSIDLLNHSLVEAVATIESNETNDSKIIYFSQLKTWKHKKFWYPTQAQLRLCQAIRHGNRIVAENAITELCKTFSIIYAEEDTIVLRFMVSSCTSQILQLSDEIGFQVDPDIVGQLVNFTTLDEYIRGLQDLSLVLLDFVDSRKADTKTILYENIKGYIDENYHRNDLSLSEIAEKFDMQPSTMSKFFRHYGGVNFIDYVTTQRIDSACELLRNSKLSIKKIMLQIGYNDLASFTRKFKSIVGTSPSKYREFE